MLLAAEDDKRAHADGLPALAKLKMLDRVMDVLQKWRSLFLVSILHLLTKRCRTDDSTPPR